ncbi:MAG TPA: N-acetylneuraminate lyase [Planctomycetes bacterium]|nr:N-acetylneuraminate lyase [Planctomycetota bacterium]HIK59945.1 N-acetylneuraminate lyase [Planctomycetota bacterium]
MTEAHQAEQGGHLLSGLVAATFTPMKRDGALDLARVPAVCDFVLGQGVSGLFLCGSTGESPSLTVDERMAVSDAYIEACGGRVPVVVHVGHNSLTDARALAAHAERAGADAIAIVPPSYFSIGSIDGLVSCIQDIAEAAPDMPLYYYHIPRLTGVGLRMVDLLERADEVLPSFAGLKFSSFELDDLLCCIRHGGGRYNVLFGSDEMLLAGLSMGAAGAVGSTFNFMGPYYRRVIDALAAGDLQKAQDEQLVATQRVHQILVHGGHNAIKAAMAVMGEDCGPPRLPWKALSAEALVAMREELLDEG